jgi:hypothetical protein
MTDTAVAPAATIAPNPLRRGHSKYPPTKREMVEAVIVCHDQAVSSIRSGNTALPAGYETLTVLLPQGSIREATLHHWEQGPVFGIYIGDRKPRFVVPTGLLITVGLSLFGGPPFIDTNKKRGQEQHYVEVQAAGFTLQRVLAGAEQGEVVRLLEDHHVLCPWAFEIVPDNPRASRDRRGVIKAALARYDRNAEAWGLTGVLSRADYERLLRSLFRLFDAEHGKHMLRPLRA